MKLTGAAAALARAAQALLDREPGRGRLCDLCFQPHRASILFVCGGRPLTTNQIKVGKAPGSCLHPEGAQQGSPGQQTRAWPHCCALSGLQRTFTSVTQGVALGCLVITRFSRSATTRRTCRHHAGNPHARGNSPLRYSRSTRLVSILSVFLRRALGGSGICTTLASSTRARRPSSVLTRAQPVVLSMIQIT